MGKESGEFCKKIRKKIMNKTKVASSNINSIGYDSNARILEIEFNNGSVYQYGNVPKAEYDALMSADSYGKYFNQYIKDVYSYIKM